MPRIFWMLLVKWLILYLLMRVARKAVENAD